MGQEQKAQKGLGSLLTLVKFFLQALIAFVWSKIQPKDYYSDNPYLHEGFGPVDDERDDKDLPVRGELPKDLHGQFVRNGPNPRFKPTGPYHWFDGDGMLHGTYIKDGKASYSNKYVRTLRWYEEEEAKSPVFMKLGDLMTPEGIVKLLGRKILEQVGLSKTFKGTGTGNTALTYHDRRLLALHEGDAPYHVVAPSLDTVGRYDYNGKLKTPFTAHPKVDQKTGEMLFFGYDVDKKPYCTYHVVNKEGELVNSLPIDLPAPVMMHDFAITEHYSIIMNLPLIFDTERVLEGKSVLYFDSTVPAKFGLVPRHAKTSEIKWFNATPCFVFHTVNAWEEGDEVVLFGCRSAHFHDSFFEIPSRKYKSFRDTTSRPFLYQWRFNIKTGEVSERVLDNDFSSEFPKVKEDLIGYKTKYAYAARFNYEVNGLPLGDAVIKYDLGDNGKKLGVIEYGPNKFGGECVFVPRHQASSEDDGYLITYVYDQTTNKSELWVMDAKNMNPKPIAVVSISRKVPYGFHGQWVSADEIEKQRVSSVS